MTKNTLLLEKLSKMLDREIRIIRCWKHLADVLGVPDKMRKKCDMYTEHSPTEDLLYHVTNKNPYLTVQQLKKKLETIFRNDVIEDLNRGMQVSTALILHHSCSAILFCIISSVGGMFYSTFLRRNFINLPRNKLTPMTS